MYWQSIGGMQRAHAVAHLNLFIYVQGTLVALTLAIGWALAGSMRRRERLQQASRAVAQPTMLLPPESPPQAGQVENCPQPCTPVAATGQGQAPLLPAVAVVLPVKGCRTHSLANWSSQVSMQYGGRSSCIFVVGDVEDPAVAAVRQLQAQQPAADIQLCVSGPASSCSQKIHNQLAGVVAAGAEVRYVLFLDDDVEPHPHCLEQLVQCLEADPSLFMATGYPFDVPPHGASLATYCTLAYHLPLLIAFSVRQRTSFVWGGCMLLRRESLDPDHPCGLFKVWRDGGYSDDLLLAALCTEQGRAIATPSFAIFPQWLDRQSSWGQYWNYLRRQLFVLDTYFSSSSRLLNHGMMLLHSWASAAFAVAGLMSLLRLTYLAACLACLVANHHGLLPPSISVQKRIGEGDSSSSTPWHPVWGHPVCQLAADLLLAPLHALWLKLTGAVRRTAEQASGSMHWDWPRSAASTSAASSLCTWQQEQPLPGCTHEAWPPGCQEGAGGLEGGWQGVASMQVGSGEGQAWLGGWWLGWGGLEGVAEEDVAMLAFLLAVLLAHLALHWMTGEVLELLRTLSPARRPAHPQPPGPSGNDGPQSCSQCGTVWEGTSPVTPLARRQDRATATASAAARKSPAHLHRHSHPQHLESALCTVTASDPQANQGHELDPHPAPAPNHDHGFRPHTHPRPSPLPGPTASSSHDGIGCCPAGSGCLGRGEPVALQSCSPAMPAMPYRSLHHPGHHFKWLYLWAALLLESLVLPLCVLYTAWTPTIQWAGVTYKKQRGKVSVVHRAGS